MEYIVTIMKTKLIFDSNDVIMSNVWNLSSIIIPFWKENGFKVRHSFLTSGKWEWVRLNNNRGQLDLSCIGSAKGKSADYKFSSINCTIGQNRVLATKNVISKMNTKNGIPFFFSALHIFVFHIFMILIPCSAKKKKKLSSPFPEQRKNVDVLKIILIR